MGAGDLADDTDGTTVVVRGKGSGRGDEVVPRDKDKDKAKKRRTTSSIFEMGW